MLADTQKLVAPEKLCIFLYKPYMRLLYAWWKKYVFDNFRAFYHFGPCKRMRDYAFPGRNTQKVNIIATRVCIKAVMKLTPAGPFVQFKTKFLIPNDVWNEKNTYLVTAVVVVFEKNLFSLVVSVLNTGINSIKLLAFINE